jgi:hypothetical protein
MLAGILFLSGYGVLYALVVNRLDRYTKHS